MNKEFDITELSKHFYIAAEQVNPRIYMVASRKLIENSKYGEAIQVLKEGTQNYPEDFLLKFRLGKYYFLQNDIENAVPTLEAAQQMRPSDRETNDLLDQAKDKQENIKFETPIIENQELDLTEISNYFNGATEDINADTYLSVAYNLRMNDQEGRGVDVLEEGVENFPNDYLLWFRLGKSLYFLDEFEDAEDVLEKALELATERNRHRGINESNEYLGKVRNAQQHNRL